MGSMLRKSVITQKYKKKINNGKKQPLVSGHGARKWAEKQKTCKQLLIIAVSHNRKLWFQPLARGEPRPPPLPGSKEVLEMSEKPGYVLETTWKS